MPTVAAPADPNDESPESDGRSQTSAENGKSGGIPKGTELPTKRTYEPSALAQAAAETILSGKPFLNPNLGPLTIDDRRSLKRALGEPIEVFQARITSKLESLVDETADIIAQTLKEPIGSKTGFRADTLPSLMAIGLDKLQALSGRSTSIGSVHIQINNNPSSDRSQVLGNLKVLRGDKVDAIAV